MNCRLADGVDWVGYVDWAIRDFHGYRTERGSSYNSYLIQDQHTALIDTVKAPYAETLIAHVSALTDPRSIRYVVCNHAEPDHAGSLPRVLEVCPDAELVCDAKCRDALTRYHDTSTWKFKVVADGETLSLGKRNLTFMETPMVHWPESMFTYVPEEKLLFSMDAFGQHYAAAHRFDDAEPLDVVLQEAKTYYANIVMLYSRPIARALERGASLDIEMIAPSHGVIWRSHADRILAAYHQWVAGTPRAKVVVMYDSMWASTAKMAQAIVDGALEIDVDVRLYNVHETNITTLATEMLDAATAAFGSPTLNTTLMPTMAAALTYLKGLKPACKGGLAFGSYGWSKGGARDIEEYLRAMKFEILCEPLQAQFSPDPAMLAECRAAGRMLAEKALAAANAAGREPE